MTLFKIIQRDKKNYFFFTVTLLKIKKIFNIILNINWREVFTNTKLVINFNNQIIKNIN